MIVGSFIDFDFVLYGKQNPEFRFAAIIFNPETGNTFTYYVNQYIKKHMGTYSSNYISSIVCTYNNHNNDYSTI